MNMPALSNYALCRLCIAFVWLYHGVVPKLLGPHRDELAMNMALGLTVKDAELLARFGGVSEVLLSVAVILFWKQRWPLVLTAAAMVALLMYALVAVPELAMGAFNPVTTNLCVLVLSLVALNQLEKSSCASCYAG
ncbi:DoxX-like family protein [uncultured Microbulbifer sp.]|uniref:DoxX-like family protein n=1 Tax=uncultured Microbulbifer sp. TaxID=348147 RepID=UPI002607ACDE|nr:DoxX-like family protein [uncultured Microbulbifer sp.]